MNDLNKIKKFINEYNEKYDKQFVKKFRKQKNKKISILIIDKKIIIFNAINIKQFVIIFIELKKKRNIKISIF